MTGVDLLKDCLKACKDGRLYDFIANNYYRLGKDDLKDIILELIYTFDIDGTEAELLEGLHDRWNYLFDD